MQNATHQLITLGATEEKDYGAGFGDDVLSGLSCEHKSIPCKYLYDNKGSELFEAICRLPEYYLTRSEAEIFTTHHLEIVDALPHTPFNVIELGAGDGHKTRILLNEIRRRNLNCQYIPIDISNGALKTLLTSLEAEMPKMPTLGLVSEYFDGLEHLGTYDHRPNIVLFLGSNIGNFDKSQSSQFLSDLHCSLNKGDLLLIGFDLKKTIKTLLDAYDDAKGVTREFNMNLLRRMNRELGANFDLSLFSFYSTFDIIDGAIKSYLISLEDQDIHIRSLDRDFHFEAFEAIHTESSFKFTPMQISKLASNHGYSQVNTFYDSKGYFTDVLLRVE